MTIDSFYMSVSIVIFINRLGIAKNSYSYNVQYTSTYMMVVSIMTVYYNTTCSYYVNNSYIIFV